MTSVSTETETQYHIDSFISDEDRNKKNDL